MASTAGEAQRAAARQAAEGATGFGRGFIDLANEQARHNLATLRALGGTVDWGRVVQAVDWSQVLKIQGGYLRASLARTVQLNQRHLEAGRAAMTSAVPAARHQAG